MFRIMRVQNALCMMTSRLLVAQIVLLDIYSECDLRKERDAHVRLGKEWSHFGHNILTGRTYRCQENGEHICNVQY